MLSLKASASDLTYKSFAVGKLRKCDFALLVFIFSLFLFYLFLSQKVNIHNK